MMKEMKGVQSGLHGEDFDRSYVNIGVRFVGEDDREYNEELSSNLNVNSMGSRGFMVEGGALESDGFYGLHKSLKGAADEGQ